MRLDVKAGLSIAALLAVTLGAAGCTTAQPPEGTDASSGPVLALSTWSPGPDASYMGAPLSGELLVSGLGCTYVEQEQDLRIGLLWPQGFTARWEGKQVSIQDAKGAVLATSGSRVSLSGGYTTPTPDSVASCKEPSWTWYTVSVVLP